MPTSKLYIDSCCLIEHVRGDLGQPLSDPRANEVDFIRRVLSAGRDENIEVFTSLFSVTEVLHANGDPVDETLKRRLERLIMSGRDGIKVVGVNPKIAMLSRDLYLDKKLLGRSADRLHIATALYVNAKEFLTLDEKLVGKAERSTMSACKLMAPSKTGLLPAEYRGTDMFKDHTP